jgi:DNA-binding Xre family transcriptional regulator
MTTECIILSPEDSTIDVSPFTRSSLPGQLVVKASMVSEVFAEAAGRVFVAFDSAELLRHLGTRPTLKNHRLLLLESRERRVESRTTILTAFFRAVVATDAGLAFLPPDELAEVLAAPNAADLAIAAGYDPELESIYVVRGNLERLIVPARHFKASAASPQPVFEDAHAIDFGNALALGEYEASMDALLYEQDPHFRRELRKRQLATDESFGASIRRLRLQRGLKRTDLAGISDKEVARIERGEIAKPHAATLLALAAALEVPVEELGNY